MTGEVENTVEDIELPEDESKLQAALVSLQEAKVKNQEVQKKLLEDANEYADTDQMSEKLIESARNMQMTSSKAWYKFWETATKIPKDNKYATFTANEKKEWRDIVKGNEEFLREVVSENGIEGVTWKKVMTKKGIVITQSPEKSEVFGTRMYKVEATIEKCSPKYVLLALVRGPFLGEHDSNLLYYREHYNFVGGTTALVHQVRKVVSGKRLAPRDFFDLTNWSDEEDGSVYFTASSLKAIKGNLAGVVRGATLFRGVCLKPDGENVKLTMVSEIDPKGWAMKSYLNWYVPYALQAEIESLQKACNSVENDEERKRLIRKFVLRELEVEEGEQVE